MFPVKIILVTILTSGLIAFLGDRIGHYVGRRRMSLLKLRPRTTATIFTIITGILIALLTIFSLTLISSTARTAFFGIEQLHSKLNSFNHELAEKNSEIEKTNLRLEELKQSETTLLEKIKLLKAERLALGQDVKKLKEVVGDLLGSLKSVRGGEIFVRVGETLLTRKVPGGADQNQIETTLKEMLSEADSILRVRAKITGGEIPENQRILWLSQEEFQKAKEFLQTHQGSLAVRVNAGHNAAVGEQVVVHLEIFENQLIFKKNETIMEVNLLAKTEKKELENKIQEALFEVRQLAEKKGLLPDRRGFVGMVTYEKILGLISEIQKTRTKNVILIIKAAQNIFTAGPLELAFQVTGVKGD
jgi:septal ring factor EnvC (AmiA/AmiB activator)